MRPPQKRWQVEHVELLHCVSKVKTIFFSQKSFPIKVVWIPTVQKHNQIQRVKPKRERKKNDKKQLSVVSYKSPCRVEVSPPGGTNCVTQIMQKVQSKLFHSKTRKKIPVFNVEAKTLLEKIMDNALAKHTWENYSSFATRWKAYARDEPLCIANGIQFVVSSIAMSNPKPSYQEQLAKTLSAVSQKLGIAPTLEEKALLKMFTAGIKKAKEYLEMEEEQAIPCGKRGVLKIMRIASLDLATGVWLARKTASRWDEIMALTKKRIKYINETEICIHFTLTKSRTRNRLDHMIIVSDVPEVMSWFRSYLSAANKEPWGHVSTGKMDEFLATIPVETEDLLRASENTEKTTYSCHSFKTGALMDALAVVVQKKMNPAVLVTLAKHATPFPILPPVTVRYLRQNPILLARAAGTHDLSAEL